MRGINENEDFSPKILVVGRENSGLSILLEVLLEVSEHNRFGTKSAGINPRGEINPLIWRYLTENYSEEVELNELRSTPISAALDDHIKLVAYMTDQIRQNGPIIATTGDKMTLDLSHERKQVRNAEDLSDMGNIVEQIREQTVREVLGTLDLIND